MCRKTSRTRLQTLLSIIACEVIPPQATTLAPLTMFSKEAYICSGGLGGAVRKVHVCFQNIEAVFCETYAVGVCVLENVRKLHFCVRKQLLPLSKVPMSPTKKRNGSSHVCRKITEHYYRSLRVPTSDQRLACCVCQKQASVRIIKDA